MGSISRSLWALLRSLIGRLPETKNETEKEQENETEKEEKPKLPTIEPAFAGYSPKIQLALVPPLR